MKNSLYNKKHVREYLLFGALGAIVYIIPVLIFFFILDYNRTGIVFLGPLLFLFVIMAYSLRLSDRRPEYKSTWMMIIATHFVVLTGIILSVLLTTLLCFLYIPGFLSGSSPEVLKDAPAGLNTHNWNIVILLYICATVGNFGSGGFIGVVGAYAFKKNQTKDKTALLEAEIKPK